MVKLSHGKKPHGKVVTWQKAAWKDITWQTDSQLAAGKVQIDNLGFEFSTNIISI